MEPNASDIAYRTIKSKILAQEYLPGFQLKEVQISQEVGLTRTPVREAFIRLEREGLLKIFPNRGAFVTELSQKEIEDFYEVREALEVKAVSLAVRRANREELSQLGKMLNKTHQLYQRGAVKNYDDPRFDFHLELVKLSKNDKLVSGWKMLAAQLSLVRIKSSMTRKRYLTALSEHLEILNHIEAGGSKKAEKLLETHLHKSKINILSAFNST